MQIVNVALLVTESMAPPTDMHYGICAKDLPFVVLSLFHHNKSMFDFITYFLNLQEILIYKDSSNAFVLFFTTASHFADEKCLVWKILMKKCPLNVK